MAEEIKSPATGETPSKPASGFASYKPELGRYVRLSAFWVLIILGFYGCMRLSATLDGYESMRTPWMEGKIPVLGFPLTWSVAIATVVFLGFAAWLYWFMNRPKSADFLIETEDELKKVTWPTFGEAVDASLVVIATVVVLGLFIAGVDIVLGMFFDKFLFRR